jgi:ribosomal protein L40E
MPRGQKTCDKCGAGNGPRAKRCKECNYGFAFKVKSKEQRTTKVVKVDWRELQKGDRIKVRGGPYFEKNGEITPMGYNGKFVVDSLDDKGIRAFGVDGRSGFCHIYMGRDSRDDQTGIWKVRHKLKRLIKKSSV